MAGRSNTELKVFLDGYLTDYQAFCQDPNAKLGSVFFNKYDHTIYVEGNKVVGTQVENLEWNDDDKVLTIYPISGSPIDIKLGIDDALTNLENALKAWANSAFEAKDATILRQTDVVNDLKTESTTAPLAAAQGKVLLGKITELTNNFNKLVGTDAQGTIDTFNEIVAFLENIENTDTLEGIIAGIEQQIADLQESAGVAKINELTGDINIEGKTTYIDDTYDDGSGDIQCTPIGVTTDKNSNKVSLEINRDGALGILAMALEQASKTNESWVRFDNIDVNVKTATGEDEYHIELSSTPKVWSF